MRYRLLSTAASLLTTLHNPLNITLLSSQLLVAPAIWQKPEGLKTCLRVMGVFHSAMLALLRKEDEAATRDQTQDYTAFPPHEEPLPREEWMRAVIKGADERSSRWKHVMALGGLLVGSGPVDDERLSGSMRSTLEHALVQATNLALIDVRSGDELGAQCITLALNHSFPLLSDYERSQLDYDLLLPVLVGSAFYSSEGLQAAYFLGAVDLDVTQAPDGTLNWSPQSRSYSQIDKILARPLVTALGPLSRLVAHSVENVSNSWTVQTMIDDLAGFTNSLLTQWRGCRLSDIESHVETQVFSEETLKTTIPSLWRLFRVTLFALVIVLRGAVGRVLNDPNLAADAVAPVIVRQVLHSLRNLYFISSRLGTESFSQYTFVYLTAIDILSNYPIQADAFLKKIRPATPGSIPASPLERCLDLYFLNTAEHFTLVLSSQTNEEVLVAAAIPYLASGGNNHLLPIFEAAHSVMLAVFSAPQSAVVAGQHLAFYIDALFSVFPENLSPRQFRLAFKTLLRVTAPPSPLSAHQPDLPATLLELVYYRALHAPTSPLPPKLTPQGAITPDTQMPISEQAVLTLTLLDALPFLPLDLLEEWLPISADLLHRIEDEAMREECKKRFWDILISGEMDPDRSQICVTWFSTRGGRELVMYGPEPAGVPAEDNAYMMSGALQKDVRESKL